MQYDFIDREFFYDFIDGFIDGDFSKEHKTMNLQKAKFFLATLESEGLMYHLDDNAVDCLNQVTSPERAEQIQKTVNEIYSASLDWGKFECPIGFSIHLTNARS